MATSDNEASYTSYTSASEDIGSEDTPEEFELVELSSSSTATSPSASSPRRSPQLAEKRSRILEKEGVNFRPKRRRHDTAPPPHMIVVPVSSLPHPRAAGPPVPGGLFTHPPPHVPNSVSFSPCGQAHHPHEQGTRPLQNSPPPQASKKQDQMGGYACLLRICHSFHEKYSNFKAKGLVGFHQEAYNPHHALYHHNAHHQDNTHHHHSHHRPGIASVRGGVSSLSRFLKMNPSSDRRGSQGTSMPVLNPPLPLHKEQQPGQHHRSQYHCPGGRKQGEVPHHHHHPLHCSLSIILLQTHQGLETAAKGDTVPHCHRVEARVLPPRPHQFLPDEPIDPADSFHISSLPHLVKCLYIFFHI
ncbi:hypothetical protein CDAR_577991 [Caerostris darwini]|uniref:Uncharacterized protein n=2 Tax=Caerostris darwini TaxID=1538125 RepID=A0AAV4PZP0_9ARAC|nr:hypothetical protein CDAR_577991 [Caerostris darwini]